MPLDEEVENIFKEENPTATAVNSLVKIENDRDVELKTDLSGDEIKIHSVLAVVNDVLEMNEKRFTDKCVLGGLILSKERKSLSKERKSREEIVAVAKQPDMNISQSGMENANIMRKMFMPKQR